MEKIEKAKKITGIVFYSIWMVVALGLWIFGLYGFIDSFESIGGFGGWVVWGILCIPAIIVPIIKMMVQGAKDGWKQGANEYSASFIGNTMYVENHPLRGALLQLVANLIISVLAGPILLAINIVKNGVALYNKIMDLVKSV